MFSSSIKAPSRTEYHFREKANRKARLQVYDGRGGFSAHIVCEAQRQGEIKGGDNRMGSDEANS